MLRSMHEQLDYRIEAKDGNAGSLNDFLVDDKTWVVRYAVIDTGRWLPGRKVLMARDGIGEPNWGSRTIRLLATRDEIKNAPELEQNRPVSRQYENFLYEHYRWAPYWTPGFAGAMAMPVSPQEEALMNEGLAQEAEHGDPHLRSVRELMGYALIAGGDKAGKVEDFMCYDDTWEIPFLVANVGGWFHKEYLMVPTIRVRSIGFADRQMDLDLPLDTLGELPTYDPDAAEAGRLEASVYDYRGRVGSHEPLRARH